MSDRKGEQSLSAELEAFERERERLLKEHLGKFALFGGTSFIGTFDSFEVAYEEGVKRFGTKAFLVKQVVEHERPEMTPALTLGLLRAYS